VLELEQQGDQTRGVHFDDHRDHDARDRDPVGPVAGDRRQRHGLVTV
jgi:hypothetical protein